MTDARALQRIRKAMLDAGRDFAVLLLENRAYDDENHRAATAGLLVDFLDL
jgi:hypothetical protein